MRRRDFVAACGSTLGTIVVPRWPRARFVERWSWAMGQAVHVMVYAGSEQQGLDACAAALAELRRVEAHLTLFDDASDLCELNRHAGRAPMRVGDDLRAVLASAQRFTDVSHGAFDLAVEPLMRAWGFHRPRTTAPSAAEIVEAQEAVATAVVSLDGDRATLPSAHTQLDCGGIGVGYGIDRALTVLSERGIRRALLNVSGDIGALGAPPGEPGWLVVIPDPDQRDRAVTTRISDAALATSANTVSVERYAALVVGHVMNPATGWPAHALRQASVVTRTATEADALSTAMLVSGRRPPGALDVFCVASGTPPPAG